MLDIVNIEKVTASVNYLLLTFYPMLVFIQTQTEYNDDEIDPSRANDPPPEAVPEDFDLPEELDLDGMKGEGEEEQEGEEGAENEGIVIFTFLPF